MANLVIDIGNTALKASWCEGMTLGKAFRYQGERMLDFILSLTSRLRPEMMVLSSVRYFSDNQISDFLDRIQIVIFSIQNFWIYEFSDPI